MVRRQAEGRESEPYRGDGGYRCNLLRLSMVAAGRQKGAHDMKRKRGGEKEYQQKESVQEKKGNKS